MFFDLHRNLFVTALRNVQGSGKVFAAWIEAWLGPRGLRFIRLRGFLRAVPPLEALVSTYDCCFITFLFEIPNSRDVIEPFRLP